jgi:divalent metal cation (Fe/Co/Zn/Cd) transporter
VQRVQWLARVTIGYNLLEGLVSMTFGVTDESVALFGFGVDSLIEVASAVMVLWRFRGERAIRPKSALARERTATVTIGSLLVVLAIGTVAGAAWRLWAHAGPETAVPGLVVATLSLSFMVWLWRAKRRAAAALDSPTVRGDAACSLACIQLSTVLLAGSLCAFLTPALWWADAVAAMGLALLIAREGVESVRAARRPDFRGGCGCGGACHGEAPLVGLASGATTSHRADG